ILCSKSDSFNMAFLGGKRPKNLNSFGAGVGNTIHFVSYIIVPLGFGITMVIAGLNGVSFF
ncbi:MAG: hypothetical protein MJH11_19640, partial [Lentisphaeria bacterium]|nr:hypothetical protein [Lentisphaeria bacterium]